MEEITKSIKVALDEEKGDEKEDTEYFRFMWEQEIENNLYLMNDLKAEYETKLKEH